MNSAYEDQIFATSNNDLGASQPVLKVIGLGGGGCNAIERMMTLQLRGVDFIAANTDAQALASNPAPTRVLLGPRVTRGFGCGGDPLRGHEAADESRRELAAALAGADMVFLTAGMGGGTGTGSIPVAAEIAREQGAVTIAIVTTPFSFEMGRRQKNASEGLERLRQHTHTLISIPNDRLLYVAPRNLPMEQAFHLADDVLRQAVQGITELITEPGLINVDFAHVRRLILLGGGALMSIGHGQGEAKASQALEQALHHPLLEDVPLSSAAGVIANFSGGEDLSLFDVQTGLSSLQERTGLQTEIVFGVINDERMEGRAQVILMITGLGSSTMEEALPGFNPAKAKSTAPVPATRDWEVAPLSAPSPSSDNFRRNLPPFFRPRLQDPFSR
ncbi:MAG: cell division protein FtsZ [Chloroflexi bacterium RBG_16_57_11]|nr:MAG: cell division protein FtsZ [Chloroflexi bacterium RBG_16_57_11]